MSNNTPPKEIYLLGQDLEFMGRDDLYLVDASLTDVLGGQIKYLSEESVNEMLAEKDKEIERVKSELESQKHKIIGSLLESMNETHCEYHIEIVRNYLDNDI